MKKTLFLALTLLATYCLQAQSFVVSGYNENQKGFIGDLIKVPLQIKNTSSKPIILIIRKENAQIGSTQKAFLCPGGNCDNAGIEDLTIKLEPGQTVQNLDLALDAGLVSGFSTVNFIVFNKFNSQDAVNLDLNFSVEERPLKNDIYSSRHIAIHDVYPNPVVDFAYIDYKLLTDQFKAKMVIHNILGSELSEYELPFLENRVKIRVDDYTPGIYFYTIYLDSESVMTRKLIVKR
ncbi:MAG: T9SS type A sorting domain-containing protein [Cyclobacteriaceae bacterium]|nr:T9SS type A sorting domain-containing protein [Cyclobacteriaceae bacterium]